MWVSRVKTDHEHADLSAVDRAVLDFAVKLTREPSRIGEEDLDSLRGAGLDDGAIHDVVQVTALFNYYNRLADGLGVDLEPDMPPTSSADSE